MTPEQRATALRLADWLRDSGVVNAEVRETEALLRGLAAEPVPEWPCKCDEQGIGEPGVTCGDCPRDYGHKAAEPVQEPVAAELPAPQLLVESAQGFVEGWTRSQVRSAINLALLKRRYAAPQQPPMRCPEDGGACGAGGYCRPEPSFEQLWQALRVLFGPDLKAASLNVLIIKDVTVVYDSFIFPPKAGDD